MATSIGPKLTAKTQRDNALAVAAGGAWVAGTSWDLQADAITGTLYGRTHVEWSITNNGSTDGYDLDTYLQWSADNTTWPALGEGTPLPDKYSTTPGDDLSLSGRVPVGTEARYARLTWRNNNATDGLTVSSWSQEEITGTFP